ncbi:MAG: hypothetical protein ACKPGI_11315 [Verrucomicrobiota bacterium]
MLIYVIAACLVVGIGVGIALLVLKHDKRDASKGPSVDPAGSQPSLDRMVVQKGKLEWQEDPEPCPS